MERDHEERPLRFYPVLPRGSADPKAIVIDPRISFGRPTLAGTGVSTQAVAARLDAGAKTAHLTRDYGLTRSQIHAAGLYEKHP